ncbi:hypothetical protein AB1Y20_004478 [Prymnesium parvum]|uniref:Uncharacterized protein n=1 Tax=Prymnesium parvum TaxID=97485 RepID=A0AB34IZC9_PRYPA
MLDGDDVDASRPLRGVTLSRAYERKRKRDGGEALLLSKDDEMQEVPNLLLLQSLSPVLEGETQEIPLWKESALQLPKLPKPLACAVHAPRYTQAKGPHATDASKADHAIIAANQNAEKIEVAAAPRIARVAESAAKERLHEDTLQEPEVDEKKGIEEVQMTDSLDATIEKIQNNKVIYHAKRAQDKLTTFPSDSLAASSIRTAEAHVDFDHQGEEGQHARCAPSPEDTGLFEGDATVRGTYPPLGMLATPPVSQVAALAVPPAPHPPMAPSAVSSPSVEPTSWVLNGDELSSATRAALPARGGADRAAGHEDSAAVRQEARAREVERETSKQVPADHQAEDVPASTTSGVTAEAASVPRTLSSSASQRSMPADSQPVGATGALAVRVSRHTDLSQSDDVAAEPWSTRLPPLASRTAPNTDTPPSGLSAYAHASSTPSLVGAMEIACGRAAMIECERDVTIPSSLQGVTEADILSAAHGWASSFPERHVEKGVVASSLHGSRNGDGLGSGAHEVPSYATPCMATPSRPIAASVDSDHQGEAGQHARCEQAAPHANVEPARRVDLPAQPSAGLTSAPIQRAACQRTECAWPTHALGAQASDPTTHPADPGKQQSCESAPPPEDAALFEGDANFRGAHPPIRVMAAPPVRQCPTSTACWPLASLATSVASCASMALTLDTPRNAAALAVLPAPLPPMAPSAVSSPSVEPTSWVLNGDELSSATRAALPARGGADRAAGHEDSAAVRQEARTREVERETSKQVPADHQAEDVPVLRPSTTSGVTAEAASVPRTLSSSASQRSMPADSQPVGATGALAVRVSRHTDLSQSDDVAAEPWSTRLPPLASRTAPNTDTPPSGLSAYAHASSTPSLVGAMEIAYGRAAVIECERDVTIPSSLQGVTEADILSAAHGWASSFPERHVEKGVVASSLHGSRNGDGLGSGAHEVPSYATPCMATPSRPIAASVDSDHQGEAGQHARCEQAAPHANVEPARRVDLPAQPSAGLTSAPIQRAACQRTECAWPTHALGAQASDPTTHPADPGKQQSCESAPPPEDAALFEGDANFRGAHPPIRVMAAPPVRQCPTSTACWPLASLATSVASCASMALTLDTPRNAAALAVLPAPLPPMAPSDVSSPSVEPTSWVLNGDELSSATRAALPARGGADRAAGHEDSAAVRQEARAREVERETSKQVPADHQAEDVPASTTSGITAEAASVPRTLSSSASQRSMPADSQPVGATGALAVRVSRHTDLSQSDDVAAEPWSTRLPPLASRTAPNTDTPPSGLSAYAHASSTPSLVGAMAIACGRAAMIECERDVTIPSSLQGVTEADILSAAHGWASSFPERHVEKGVVASSLHGSRNGDGLGSGAHEVPSYATPCMATPSRPIAASVDSDHQGEAGQHARCEQAAPHANVEPARRVDLPAQPSAGLTSAPIQRAACQRTECAWPTHALGAQASDPTTHPADPGKQQSCESAPPPEDAALFEGDANFRGAHPPIRVMAAPPVRQCPTSTACWPLASLATSVASCASMALTLDTPRNAAALAVLPAPLPPMAPSAVSSPSVEPTSWVLNGDELSSATRAALPARGGADRAAGHEDSAAVRQEARAREVERETSKQVPADHQAEDVPVLRPSTTSGVTAEAASVPRTLSSSASQRSMPADSQPVGATGALAVRVSRHTDLSQSDDVAAEPWSTRLPPHPSRTAPNTDTPPSGLSAYAHASSTPSLVGAMEIAYGRADMIECERDVTIPSSLQGVTEADILSAAHGWASSFPERHVEKGVVASSLHGSRNGDGLGSGAHEVPSCATPCMATPSRPIAASVDSDHQGEAGQHARCLTSAPIQRAACQRTECARPTHALGAQASDPAEQQSCVSTPSPEDTVAALAVPHNAPHHPKVYLAVASPSIEVKSRAIHGDELSSATQAEVLARAEVDRPAGLEVWEDLRREAQAHKVERGMSQQVPADHQSEDVPELRPSTISPSVTCASAFPLVLLNRPIGLLSESSVTNAVALAGQP